MQKLSNALQRDGLAEAEAAKPDSLPIVLATLLRARKQLHGDCQHGPLLAAALPRALQLAGWATDENSWLAQDALCPSAVLQLKAAAGMIQVLGRGSGGPCHV